MVSEAGQHEIYDKLEHGLRLSNLINPESLANLIDRFAEFHRVRFFATELDGTLLGGHDPSELGIDLNGAPPVGPEDKFSTLNGNGEVRVLRARVDNQFDPVGYLYVGPFQFGDKNDLADDQFPTLTTDRAESLAQLLCTVLEEVVFANYQSYLFSKMHLQLSKENLGEVTGQAEGDDPTYEETMLDSGEFRSLF